MCNWFASIKFCNGHSSNYKRFVTLKDLRLIGMKLTCHVLLQQMLPLAFRGILSKDVRFAISKICVFFNSIRSKTNDPTHLDLMQSEFVKTLALLEKFVSPSFFNIMVHLTVHLVCEVKLRGPVFLRWMHPIEIS